MHQHIHEIAWSFIDINDMKMLLSAAALLL